MMARNNTTKRGTGRKTFAILVDGETELWYIQMLRKHEALPGISIQPELPKKKTLAQQFEAVKSNAKIYDHSIWIIDLDVIIAENTIDELKTYLEEVRGNKRINILINTPCLEYWFLMHVKDTGKYYAQCEPVSKELTKNDPLKDYAKTEKYFVRTNPDIYERLKPYLSIGIANAAKRGDFDIENPQQAKAEMYKLFGILGIKGS